MDRPPDQPIRDVNFFTTEATEITEVKPQGGQLWRGMGSCRSSLPGDESRDARRQPVFFNKPGATGLGFRNFFRADARFFPWKGMPAKGIPWPFPCSNPFLMTIVFLSASAENSIP